jgi:septum formation protein
VEKLWDDGGWRHGCPRLARRPDSAIVRVRLLIEFSASGKVSARSRYEPVRARLLHRAGDDSVNNPDVAATASNASVHGPVNGDARHVILASRSPARIALLTGANVRFIARAAEIDEREVETPLVAAGASPGEIAAALAEAKALAVAKSAGTDAIVIGADQTLDLDGRRWVKPATLSTARNQLARLSGRRHTLHSAVAAARAGAIVWRHVESPTLTMRPLTPSAIDAYLAAAGEAALASVGAYQIEGRGIQLFERIDGDYFAILGLPLLPVLAFLRREGAIS